MILLIFLPKSYIIKVGKDELSKGVPMAEIIKRIMRKQNTEGKKGMIIYSKNIVCEQGIIDGYLVVEGSIIKDIVRKEVEELEADLDYSEGIIIPGISSLIPTTMASWAMIRKMLKKAKVLWKAI